MAPVGSGMKKIGCGAATILVSDAAASAVLRCAAILAHTGGGDVVDVPTSDDDGLGAHARIALAPGIPVIATNAPPTGLCEPAASRRRQFTCRTSTTSPALLHSWSRHEPSLRGG